mmetsp:Transcript_121557/g.303305  ORF Transcript_121557/g.303305 Transcript_121557/m.303305 type:complete len:359 (+) Transcript_121557:114-1190(+)
MEGDPERFDGVLLNIAQQSGSIDGILDCFFGFLQRKTDFFTGAQDEQAAEQMVLKYYKKHWKAGQKKRLEIQEKNRIADEERKQRAEEKRKKDEEEYQKRQEEMSKKSKIEEVTDEEAAKIKAEKQSKEEGSAASAASAAGAEEGSAEAKAASSAEAAVAAAEAEDKEDGADSKEPPPPGNGGSTDKYTWTQTLGALEVYVNVRPGVKAKQIICDIGTDTLKLGIKGEPLILQGKMHAKVKPDDCMWTLIDNKIVQITIEKFDTMKWWSCVMQGDDEIDTKKIVPENSKLSDLDGETRMTVEKMMYDQRQKALGKPTSDQEKQHDLLEKFKAAHPEMDFSKAKINYGGGGGGGGFNFG